MNYRLYKKLKFFFQNNKINNFKKRKNYNEVYIHDQLRYERNISQEKDYEDYSFLPKSPSLYVLLLLD